MDRVIIIIIMSIYLMRNGDLYKIGRSKDPEVRQSILGTACPDGIRLVRIWKVADPSAVEKYLHKRLAINQVVGVRGKEWYRKCGDNMSATVDTCIQDYLGATEGPVATPGDLVSTLAAHPVLADLYTKRQEANAMVAHHISLRELWDLRMKRVMCDTNLRQIRGMDDSALVSWDTRTSRRLDQAKLKREHPDLHAACMKDSQSTSFVVK